MEIKKVNPQELAEILFEIDNKAFTRPFDFPATSPKQEADYLKRSETYIAYEDGTPVGLAAYEATKGGIEIKSLAIVPDYQGMGRGRELLRYMLKLIGNLNVFLVTHPKNKSAITLYLKEGFEIYGWKDNYYGDGEPRLLLKLER